MMWYTNVSMCIYMHINVYTGDFHLHLALCGLNYIKGMTKVDTY